LINNALGGNNPFKNQSPFSQKKDLSPMSSVKSGSNDGGSIKDKPSSQGSFNFSKKYTCKLNELTLSYLEEEQEQPVI